MLLIAAQTLDQPASPMARALRRLAPTAQRVVVGLDDTHEQRDLAISAGFDAYQAEPITTDAPWWPDSFLSTNDAAPPTEATPGPTIIEDPPDQPATGVDAGEALGDIDLIDEALSNHSHLPDLALRIIADRSGLHGIGLTGEGESPPASAATATVEHHGRAFGTLWAAPPATDESLAPWAPWLGRWLALDRHVHQLRHMALSDELTDVRNRRYFNQFLSKLLDRAADERFQVTVLVFDIDDFKSYNDRYGHAAGDEILRETAKLMRSVVREHDVVARVGGDEFAVIFWDSAGPRKPNSHHPQDVRQAADRFQQAVRTHRFPKLTNQAPGALTISGGLAGFPWDGRTPEQLIEKADQMAIQSKRQGKNAITYGPGVDGCGPAPRRGDT